ncbi:MAG: aspartate aminotransferase family protein [Pseudorhodoplanes sp.]|nr:Succinylornithine transaminase/acetylornithine aminotransferase [Pseudorhodoplanes sp.]MBW7948277.1 aspartate aminotransferase family protein [Pseudorhodoplanes sp.]MCQ3941637.1 acetylornithine transaminase [Alphaproteobacteria bacterium]
MPYLSGAVDTEGLPIEYLSVPPVGAAHFVSDGAKNVVDDRKTVVKSHLLPTYARADLAFERGEGAWLVSTAGERYLDFTAGVAVNVLGHAHPQLVAALTEQAQKIWHVSNLFRIPEAERLAERLCRESFADTVFFANSGAEALECSIKMARKFHAVQGRPERFRIVTFEGAFHGRTLATLAAGGQKKYLEGFGPVTEGFDQVAFGDFDAAKRAVGDATAAILIEPVMGEGGVRVVPPQFLKALRELCNQRGLLLMFDEVQTGVGRTGELFAYQRSGIVPDIMALAKALGGGFPVGACLATADAAQGMTAGTHGSTFGGNPLAMSVGNAVLDVVLARGFLENVRKMSLRLKQRLAELKDRFPSVIEEVRGEGLLLGLKAAVPNGDLVKELRAEKLLAVAAGDNVVRLLPPLIIGEAEVIEALGMIERACSRLASTASKEKAAV